MILSVEQWETYHRGGAIATCPTAPDGGYDREVRDAWVQFFSTLPPEACILDVGCGNGVVTLIAKETADSLGMRWEIHGSDLANTDPMRLVADGPRRFAGITFHPGVATERLPFADAYFDAVSGHYALEYTDTDAALREIHRVLKPGGDAQFVLHHSDSVLVRSAQVSLREGDLVLSDTKLYKRLHRLVAMERVVPQTTQKVADELRASIQTIKEALAFARQVGGGRVLSVALDGVQKLLAARKDVNAQATALEVDRAEQEMRDALRRLRDLISHACTLEMMERIEQQARERGFSLIERFPLYHDGSNLVGWQLMMHRD